MQGGRLKGRAVAGEPGAADLDTVDTGNLRGLKPSCHGNAVTV